MMIGTIRNTSYYQMVDSFNDWASEYCYNIKKWLNLLVLLDGSLGAIRVFYSQQ